MKDKVYDKFSKGILTQGILTKDELSTKNRPERQEVTQSKPSTKISNETHRILVEVPKNIMLELSRIKIDYKITYNQLIVEGLESIIDKYK